MSPKKINLSPKFPTTTLTFRDKSFPLLQTRPVTSLTLDTLQVINMITLDPMYPPSIVGSFKYIVHEYPADIDLFETYNTCCDIDEATTDVATKFREMVKRITSTKNVYLGDFKAGYDTRYTVNIGHIKNDKIKGYNPLNIRSTIVSLHNKGLLTDQEVGLWLSKVIDHPSFVEYIDLESTIRSKHVVRWNTTEVIKGEKILPLGVKLSLKDALSQKSVVKVDVWVYLNNRHVEVTNWFMLTYKDKKGRTQHLSVKPDEYERSLTHDIQHYNNPTVNKYMKLAKRLWLYAVLKKDKKLMISLYPLFGSGAAKMYQIMGEIETIHKILLRIEKPYMPSIIDNIEDWKTRLGTIMSDILPIPVAHSMYEKINVILTNRQNIEEITYGLKDLEDKLNLFVNRYVRLYFRRNNINPTDFIT